MHTYARIVLALEWTLEHLFDCTCTSAVPGFVAGQFRISKPETGFKQKVPFLGPVGVPGGYPSETHGKTNKENGDWIDCEVGDLNFNFTLSRYCNHSIPGVSFKPRTQLGAPRCKVDRI